MSRKILIVDDDPIQQGLLSKLLGGEGYRIETAQDGLEALTRVEQVQPDLIIADAVMPRLDGMTFLRALKGHAETRRIPVIIVTALDDPQYMMEATNLGARFFITKPFNLEEVSSKVRKALR